MVGAPGGERSHAKVLTFVPVPKRQECVQRKPLSLGQIHRENLKHLALGTYDDFSAMPLQYRQSRNNDGSPPQFVDPRPNQNERERQID